MSAEQSVVDLAQAMKAEERAWAAIEKESGRLGVGLTDANLEEDLYPSRPEADLLARIDQMISDYRAARRTLIETDTDEINQRMLRRNDETRERRIARLVRNAGLWAARWS